MSVLQRLCPGGNSARHWRFVVPALAGLLPALIFSAPAGAVTHFSVDGQSPPYTFIQGQTYTLRWDVGKAGGGVNYALARDLNGSGQYDPTAPVDGAIGFADGGGGDTDAAPGKIAILDTFGPGDPAGPYVLELQDTTDNTTLAVPGITVVPQPQPQALSGHVAVVTAANPAGTPPPDALVWAYDATQQPVANANVRADGSYTLPLPPGTYTLFAEWFGHLHSQRQSVTLAANQQASGVNIALLQGQEVAGSVRVADQRPGDDLVQATSTTGVAEQSAHTLADGTFVLVLPSGQHQITAAGVTQAVTVGDGPVDGVDFPPAAPGPAPAQGTILTVAGNGIAGNGGDGRPATTARLLAPLPVVVDRAGNLYIGLNQSNTVQKVDAVTGIITRFAGVSPVETIRGLQPSGGGGYGGDGGPATQALLNSPQYLALDQAGNLYISDFANNRIRKVDAVTGIITTVVGTGQDGFSGDGGPATQAQIGPPQAIAFDAAGNLYVVDGEFDRVRRVDPNGIITTVAGGGTAPPKDGVQATTVALGVTALATDAAGNLYLGGTLNQIFKMSPAGVLTLVVGTGTAGFAGDGGPAVQAEFNFPFPTMAVDSAGNLFFADGFNNRIRKVSPDGKISTVAGSGPYFPDPGSFAGDGGPATAAQLNIPFSPAIDAAGNLIFTDVGNNRVRKVIGIAAPGLIAGQ